MKHMWWMSLSAATMLALTGCATEPEPTMAPSRYLEQPYLEQMPPTGQEVPYALLTHCGVEFARIGGRTWQVRQLPTAMTKRQAPEGWGNPFEEGRLLLDTSSRATFTTRNTVLVYEKAAEGTPVPDCK